MRGFDVQVTMMTISPGAAQVLAQVESMTTNRSDLSEGIAIATPDYCELSGRRVRHIPAGHHSPGHRAWKLPGYQQYFPG